MIERAKPVSLVDLQCWVKNNEHRTWHWPRLDSDQPLTLEIKYLNFSLDTRDMDVWRIWIDGTSCNGIQSSTHDDFEGTIIELLEKRLNDARRKHD